jgi:hypothetical protein
MLRQFADAHPGLGGEPVERGSAIGAQQGEDVVVDVVPVADEPGRWRGEPGTRLPHLWLTGVSTLDLVRDGRYLLLTGPDGHAWAQAARETDPTSAFLDVARLPHRADRCGIDQDGALLVRPDHVIAWRATHATPHALADAAARALGHRSHDFQT